MENKGRKEKKFQNIGSGILWKNKFKKTDREPFFRGKATVRGHDIELAAWLKKDKNGNDMISIAFDDPIEVEESSYKRSGNRKEKSLEELFGG